MKIDVRINTCVSEVYLFSLSDQLVGSEIVQAFVPFFWGPY